MPSHCLVTLPAPSHPQDQTQTTTASHKACDVTAWTNQKLRRYLAPPRKLRLTFSARSSGSPLDGRWRQSFLLFAPFSGQSAQCLNLLWLIYFSTFCKKNALLRHWNGINGCLALCHQLAVRRWWLNRVVRLSFDPGPDSPEKWLSNRSSFHYSRSEIAEFVDQRQTDMLSSSLMVT